ncbi:MULTISPECIES: SigE family RNA polymerase sigma factor [Nonomuraea]|uniref:SigE family RNA polymerase sigma factor n=2 Tax=Nonomuraea TaxID=83681 RepID=A0ABW1BS68_9ACTN|nr:MULTISPECIES: SigE family RNA polymerase sigma factor [Nonomuraea]MDA0643340.1 SigE family RNA polymerase sigma factor [Nonomuraea ferruginea]TXK38845.1 SigE family RNA polymerase sigma factor [Nonomuraea sp. C10]
MIDTEGFRDFVAARGHALSRTAFLLTGDHGQAEDLLQETLVKAATRWRRVSAAADPEAYVRTMMLNQLRTWRRPRRLTIVPTADLPDSGPHHDQSTQADLKIMLGRALGVLTAKQRIVLYLRFYEDLPESAVAAQLGCSVGTVKRHAHDALNRLRRVAPRLLERVCP